MARPFQEYPKVVRLVTANGERLKKTCKTQSEEIEFKALGNLAPNAAMPGGADPEKLALVERVSKQDRELAELREMLLKTQQANDPKAAVPASAVGPITQQPGKDAAAMKLADAKSATAVAGNATLGAAALAALVPKQS